MTGSDAEILCGEWQTGDTPQSVSGEQYNIRLDIKKIVRHPDYFVQLNTSSFLQFDVAVFKVYETFLQEVSCSNNSNIYHFALSLIWLLWLIRRSQIKKDCTLHACPPKQEPRTRVFIQGGPNLCPQIFYQRMLQDF